MDNWEDRLAASMPAKKGKNWEDRMHSASYETPPNPADSGSTLQFGPFDTGIKLGVGPTNFLAGTGKALSDTVKGIGQMVGAVSRDDVREMQKRDAPLMATGAGAGGNLFGNAVTLLPLAAVPGAATLKGASMIGAATGLLQPSASTAETASNIGMGAAMGPVGNIAGRTIGAVAGTVKGLAQPFFQSGRQAMIGDLIHRFTPDVPAALSGLRTNAAELIPGSFPTAAEAAGSTGIAQLTKQVQQLSTATKDAFFQRGQQQGAARIGAVRDIAGDEASRATAVTARADAARPLYEQAQSAILQADPTLTNLMTRPSMRSAMGRALTLSEEGPSPIRFGQDIPTHFQPSGLLDASGASMQIPVAAQSTSYTGKGLQYVKMGLDDILHSPATSGMGSHEEMAIKGTRSELVKWLQQNNPTYAQADATFANMSRPINQMDVGKSLSDTLIPALNDFGATGNLRASGFAQAMRNGDATAQRVLGYPGATMANVMEPAQMQTLNALGQDLARSQNGVRLAAAPGSDTAQNLASQNLIKGIMGPLGMPDGMASSTFLRTIARPAQWVNSLTEPQIMQQLGDTLLSPRATLKVLQSAQAPGLLESVAEKLRRVGTASGLLYSPRIAGGLLAEPVQE
jgi:hypothetical protein